MGGQIRFNREKMAALKSTEWSEDDTISRFFDQSLGYQEEVSYAQGTEYVQADPPKVELQSGATMRGVIAHLNLANLDENNFSIVYERVSAGAYEPLTGDLAVTLKRKGKHF